MKPKAVPAARGAASSRQGEMEGQETSGFWIRLHLQPPRTPPAGQGSMNHSSILSVKKARNRKTPHQTTRREPPRGHGAIPFSWSFYFDGCFLFDQFWKAGIFTIVLLEDLRWLPTKICLQLTALTFGSEHSTDTSFIPFIR